MGEFNHILAKHGVLTAFSIAKKVKQSDITKFRKELKKSCKDGDKMNERLEQMILLHVNNSIQSDEIPGLIFDDVSTQKSNKRSAHDPFKSIPLKLKQKIVGVALITHQLLRKENFNKELILIFLQILLMESKITNADIKSFNEKYKLDSLNNDSYLEEDNGDDEGDEPIV